MTFHLGGGKITITGSDGLTRLDTDDALFHTITPVSGTLNVAAYSNPDSTNANVTTSYTLGTCDALCTDVIGAVYFTNTTAQGLPNDRWTTFMGGTLLWMIDGHGTTGGSPDPNINMNQAVMYSLRVTSGTVYLDRRMMFSKEGQGIYTILAHDIQYKLKCGVWV